MAESTAQVRISNIIGQREDGSLKLRVLSIKRSELILYVAKLIDEVDSFKYEPERSKRYDHLPLLSLIDLEDTGEEFLYATEAEFPSSTVYSSAGTPILIILPETDAQNITVNRFDIMEEAAQERLYSRLKV